MSSTNFSTGTIIQSTWLNDVNNFIYNTLPTIKAVAYSGNKSDIGLGNVDNTSDVNKPISTATQTALNLKQDTSAKDASGGYAGLSGYNINFKNVAGTFTSAFTNTNTAARTYTFPDKNITVAGLADIPAAGFSNMVVITTTQTWVPPAGVTKAEVTVVNGGMGTGGSPQGGPSGAAGTSILSVNPSTTYTATIGAGGVGGGTAGGSTTFAGSGITTLTTTNALLKYSAKSSGSDYAPAYTVFGDFGRGGQDGSAGNAGVVIIRY